MWSPCGPSADTGQPRSSQGLTAMAHKKLVVMGVAGCGKSTVAAQLAQEMGATLIEGDEHHSPSNQEKMRNGIALQDSDRAPWLDTLGSLLAAASCDIVLTCSALKRSYRERLRAAVPGLRIVYLEISLAEAHCRVASHPSIRRVTHATAPATATVAMRDHPSGQCESGPAGRP